VSAVPEIPKRHSENPSRSAVLGLCFVEIQPWFISSTKALGAASWGRRSMVAVMYSEVHYTYVVILQAWLPQRQAYR
jgi:hypothetical protein